MRFDVFETVYGTLYDAGVQSRLAPLGGFVMWGADVDGFLNAMADGVACRKGQVVVDCPTGGGVTFARGLPKTRGLLVGVDLSSLMLARAGARALQLPAAQRDHRVLKPGGELVGTTLTADAPLPWLVNVRAAQLSGFFVPPDSARLRADAQAAGFQRWETERTGALLFFRGS